MTDIHEANGARFIAQDDMIVRHIRAGKGDFETETIAWLMDVIDADRAYVDVGHSTGWLAIPVAMRGIDVYGFEPLPNSFKRSLENMALNGVDYYLRNAAVSSESGRMTLRYNPRLPLTSGASLEPHIHGGSAKMEVDVVTLDEALPRNVDVGFLKVDVEGHEIHVLHGAAKTIDRCRPHMILEANTSDKVDELNEHLAEIDYDWTLVDRRNMLCTPR